MKLQQMESVTQSDQFDAVGERKRQVNDVTRFLIQQFSRTSFSVHFAYLYISKLFSCTKHTIEIKTMLYHCFFKKR